MNVISRRSHLGHYEVDNKIYSSKILATQNCKKGEWPRWVFNHDVFSKFNWKQEPTEDLYELYKQRAWQLRQQYDKLILFYSGGIDSSVVLKTFVENKIPLDLIVSYGSFNFNYWKTLQRNQEIDRVAIPEIKKILNYYKLDTPYVLIDDWHLFDNFKDESWIFNASPSSFRPETYVFNFYHTHPEIQKMMSKGKTAIIRGMDKPKLLCEEQENGNKWSLVFLDAQAGGAEASGLSEKINSWYDVEYFYWARNFPKILCKQSHIIKNYFEQKKDITLIRSLFSKGTWGDSKINYNNWIDPLIYGKYLNQEPGENRKYFSLGKWKVKNSGPKDFEFFIHGNEKAKTYWKKGMEYIVDNVDHFYMDGFDGHKRVDLKTFIEKGFTGIYSDPYYLN